eukprot:m.29315 g.29315  ORF g.29315 m.29315 type:complete len:60 (+) comp6139_c0_seq1:624-803(+)
MIRLLDAHASKDTLQPALMSTEYSTACLMSSLELCRTYIFFGVVCLFFLITIIVALHFL